MAREFRFLPLGNGRVSVAYEFGDANSALRFIELVNDLEDTESSDTDDVPVPPRSTEVHSAPSPVSPTMRAKLKSALLEMRGLISAKVLLAIRDAERGIASDVYLRTVLAENEGDSFNLAPAFSNLSKTLKRHGLAVTDIYDRETRRNKKKQLFWYRLKPVTIELIDEIDDFANGSNLIEMESPFN
jgi:hypothetical protein